MDEPSKCNDSKGYPKNASFWAFTLSIFVHACVIYVFDLSPTSFLKTTKCWFFISITIIFIVATDFGSNYRSILEEEVKDSPRIHNFSSFDSQVRVKYNIPREKEKSPYDQCQEKVIHEVVLSINETNKETGSQNIIRHQDDHSKDMFHDSLSYIPSQNQAKTHDDTRNKESIEEIVVYDKSNMSNITTKELEEHVSQIEEEENNGSDEDKEENITTKELEEHVSQIEEEEENNGRDEDKEEKDEFSRMSNEEVNRRFEEFIQRCNQQIRLQEAQMRRFNSF